MYNYLIYNQLKNYAKADKSFHMPGHKARGDFKSKFAVAPLDITELSYSDNLLCPKGVIAQAQADIAEILGASKSYILTDGSSSGVLSMLFAVAGLGAKVIVPRNSHQSVWNACKLLNIEPVIVQGGSRDGVLLPPDPALIETLVSGDKTISAMIVTSPDYYGNIAPLEEYKKILHRHGRYLLVDGAHGGHLAFEAYRRGYAGVYADLWVDGAHKTMPALTQGAIVSANCQSLIPALEEGLSVFRTTSPSFPIMASVEYAVKYLYNNPEIVAEARGAVEAFKLKSSFKLYPSEDWTKLAVDFEPLGISSHGAAQFLEKKGIYAELSDGKHLLFYLSPMVTAADLNALSSALTAVTTNKKLKIPFIKKPDLPVLQRTYSFLYALRQPRELVPLSQAAGRMAARNVGISPPCTPVTVAGEIITEAALKVLEGADGLFGVENGNIWVVKK